MRGVGYVAGKTLDNIQNQWAQFIHAKVDVILIDREVFKSGFDYANPTNSTPEKEAISQYMETMSAAQDMTGNYDRYETLDDLRPGDTLVLSSLKVLRFAKRGIWGSIIEMHKRGVHLAVLSEGCNSSGSYGDKVLLMLNDIYQLGCEDHNKKIQTTAQSDG